MYYCIQLPTPQRQVDECSRGYSGWHRFPPPPPYFASLPTNKTTLYHLIKFLSQYQKVTLPEAAAQSMTNSVRLAGTCGGWGGRAFEKNTHHVLRTYFGGEALPHLLCMWVVCACKGQQRIPVVRLCLTRCAHGLCVLPLLTQLLVLFKGLQWQDNYMP